MNRTIGIVGGSGYVGSSLARHLSRAFDVRIIDVNSPKTLPANASFDQCDITKLEETKDVLQDVDVVIHTAIVQIPMVNEQKRLAYDVNIIGTQNVCKAVEESPRTKGMILASSWHVFGEIGLDGVINEEFGFRPDKVEERARLYALSKIAQEAIVRFYDEISNKIFGIVRMGTVLGENMPEKTAASIFIERGLNGDCLTPYKHSLYRPMLYVDIRDVCRVYEFFLSKILNNRIDKSSNSLEHIVNVCYPTPVTILELAEMIKELVAKNTNGCINPRIEVIDLGCSSFFFKEDKRRVRVDTSKVKRLLGVSSFISTRQSVESILKSRLRNMDEHKASR